MQHPGEDYLPDHYITTLDKRFLYAPGSGVRLQSQYSKDASFTRTHAHARSRLLTCQQTHACHDCRCILC